MASYLGAMGFLVVLMSTHVVAAKMPVKRVSSKKLAVLVGANEATIGRAPLRFSYEDVRRMAAVLVEVGGFAPENVQVLEDPEPAEVLRQLDKKMNQAKKSIGGSMMLFYYSGHSDSMALYPDGKPLLLSAIRSRLDNDSATVRVGIIDACRGGGWTGAKGLSAELPFEVVDVPMELESEGSVLIASSSGQETAHESAAIRGSFFTHHFVAGLRGAADQSGDGEVTVGEAFAYAKEFTIRDSTIQANAPQHPSFDMNLRGRTDIALSRVNTSQTLVELRQSAGPLQLIQLSTGLVVLEVPPGRRTLSVAIPAGRYLVRRRAQGVNIYAKEITVQAYQKIEVNEESLELIGTSTLASKGVEETAWSALTTIAARKMEASFRLGLMQSAGRSETMNYQGFGASGTFAWGLTDRFQWILPFPSVAYRFGNRGGWEWVPFFSIAPLLDCSNEEEMGKLGIKTIRDAVVYFAQSGISSRWWISGNLTINSEIALHYFGSFEDPRDAISMRFINGFSYMPSQRFTLNISAGIIYPFDDKGGLYFGGGKRLVFGSVQTMGLRNLPLFQIHLSRYWSIDGHVTLEQDSKDRLTNTIMGGMTWSF